LLEYIIAGRVNTFIAEIKVYGLFVRSETSRKSWWTNCGNLWDDPKIFILMGSHDTSQRLQHDTRCDAVV